MEYNLPSEIVKDLNFGGQAKNKIIAGVDKLAKAVKSTLGALGAGKQIPGKPAGPRRGGGFLGAIRPVAGRAITSGRRSGGSRRRSRFGGLLSRFM